MSKCNGILLHCTAELDFAPKNKLQRQKYKTSWEFFIMMNISSCEELVLFMKTNFDRTLLWTTFSCQLLLPVTEKAVKMLRACENFMSTE